MSSRPKFSPKKSYHWPAVLRPRSRMFDSAPLSRSRYSIAFDGSLESMSV